MSLLFKNNSRKGRERLHTRVVVDVGSASFDAQSLMVGLDRDAVFLPSPHLLSPLSFVHSLFRGQLSSELPDVGGEPIWPLYFPFTNLLKLRETSLSPEG